MNERDIFANTILAQKVASRYASQGSSTPSFDAAVKTDLEPKITPIVNRASKLADKAEDTKKPEELQKIAETSAQQAYLVLDMLRPVLSKGKGELGDVREDSPKVVKYASGLVDALKDLDEKRNHILEHKAKMDPGEIAKAVHNVFMSLSGVKSAYNGLRDHYGR